MLAITERGVIHSVNNAGVRVRRRAGGSCCRLASRPARSRSSSGTRSPRRCWAATSTSSCRSHVSARSARVDGRAGSCSPPHAPRPAVRTFHNSYLHAYITTGRRNVLGTTGTWRWRSRRLPECEPVTPRPPRRRAHGPGGAQGRHRVLNAPGGQRDQRRQRRPPFRRQVLAGGWRSGGRGAARGGRHQPRGHHHRHVAGVRAPPRLRRRGRTKHQHHHARGHRSAARRVPGSVRGSGQRLERPASCILTVPRGLALPLCAAMRARPSPASPVTAGACCSGSTGTAPSSR